MIKPNVVAIIKINDFSQNSALLIPSIIIKQDIKGSYVYVAARQSNITAAQKKYISAGLSYGETTMVTDGLLDGEMVITSGYNQISDGTALEVRKK